MPTAEQDAKLFLDALRIREGMYEVSRRVDSEIINRAQFGNRPYTTFDQVVSS